MENLTEAELDDRFGYKNKQTLVHPDSGRTVPKFCVIWKYNQVAVVREVHGDRPTEYHFFNLKNGVYEFICSNDKFEEGHVVAKDVWYPKQEFKKVNIEELALDVVSSTLQSVISSEKKLPGLKKEYEDFLNGVQNKKIKKMFSRLKSQGSKQTETEMENIVKDTLSNSIKQCEEDVILRQDDLALVYMGTDGSWKAFYPSIQQLLSHHLNLPKEDQKSEYIDLLQSTEFKDRHQELLEQG